METVQQKKIMLIGTVAASFLGFRRQLIIDLVSDGYEVYAAGIDFDQHSINEIIKIGANPLIYKMKRGGVNPFSDMIGIVSIYSLISKVKPTIVFCYFVKPVIFGGIAAYLAKVKFRVGMIEGLGYGFTCNPSRMTVKRKVVKLVQVFLYSISLRIFDRLVFLNSDDPSELKKYGLIKLPEISFVKGVGVDLEEFKGCPPPVAPLVFVFIGRLVSDKGILDFVAAASRVKHLFPSVKFLIVGGEDDGNPEALSPELVGNIKNNLSVEYIGVVNNVYPILTASSVFVLPSYREGFPRSTQEAMAVGRAVITYDAPGCRETVKHMLNGIIVKPGCIEALSEAIIHFIKNPTDVLEMGKQSLKIAEQDFNIKVLNDQMIGIIKKGLD